MPKYPDPIKVAAQTPASKPENSAAIIFMHGLGDDGMGWENIAHQFQSIKRLPYMQWIFPTAPQNMDAMQTAWYTPSSLPRLPSSRPELVDPEDEDGLKESREYIVTLIDGLIAEGVPANRIVIGGFSQGCAMTFLIGLTSKHAGKLAGLMGLMGYMPLVEKMEELRKESGLSDDEGLLSPVFHARGSSDMMVPKRFFDQANAKLKELGVKDELVETHEYEGQGHQISPKTLQDMCFWMEKIIPPLE